MMRLLGRLLLDGLRREAPHTFDGELATLAVEEVLSSVSPVRPRACEQRAWATAFPGRRPDCNPEEVLA